MQENIGKNHEAARIFLKMKICFIKIIKIRRLLHFLFDFFYFQWHKMSGAV